MDLLLQNTYEEISSISAGIQAQQKATKVAACNLSCATQLVQRLFRYKFNLDDTSIPQFDPSDHVPNNEIDTHRPPNSAELPAQQGPLGAGAGAGLARSHQCLPRPAPPLSLGRQSSRSTSVLILLTLLSCHSCLIL